MKQYLKSLVESAYKDNQRVILSAIQSNPKARLLDIGCGDGTFTTTLQKKLTSTNVWGIDIVDTLLKQTNAKGIKTVKSDINKPLPFKDSSFDVVVSNQVIEHLSKTDLYLSEIHRILRPNGYAVLSTENLASWHNIFALLLGFQPFSMTNVSDKGIIGNPLALWHDKISTVQHLNSWQHMRLFSYYGFYDVCKRHGFTIEWIKTSGYYPLPSFFSVVDPYHGHWMTLKLIKKH